MLEIKNVTISYGERPVVRDFSMTLGKGRSFRWWANPAREKPL